jgi:hypothetical protein
LIEDAFKKATLDRYKILVINARFGLESLLGSLIAVGSSFIFWLLQKITMGMNVTERKSYAF